MSHNRATSQTLGDEEPYIYKKGPAFGMPGVHVDGMDVLKVREVALEAIARARRGDGPTLIECETYRFRGHSLAGGWRCCGLIMCADVCLIDATASNQCMACQCWHNQHWHWAVCRCHTARWHRCQPSPEPTKATPSRGPAYCLLILLPPCHLSPALLTHSLQTLMSCAARRRRPSTLPGTPSPSCAPTCWTPAW
jgi:hypothetical protein